MAPITVGVFMTALDVGAVNVSLPSISTHFQTDLSTIQWVVSVYLLVLAATLLPMGRAADLLGRKRIYVAAYFVFVVGSLLAGSAVDFGWLLGARALQAAGTAAIQATGIAIAVSAFPEGERGKVLGVVVTTVGLGIVTGPVLGGGLIDLLGWRAAFFINAVVGPIGLVLAHYVLHDDRHDDRVGGRLDWTGMASSAVLLASIVFFMSRGNAAGWGSPIIVTAGVLAAAAFAVFMFHESRASDPMIDLRLFRRRAFALGSLASFLAFSAIISNSFIITFYIQGILGYAPAETGLILAPQAFVLAIAGAVFGRLADRFDGRIFAAGGMIITMLSLLWMSRLDMDSSALEVMLILMGVSLGMGMFAPSNNSSVVSSVEPERYGLVAGFLGVMRSFGQVHGIAAATLIVSVAITSLGVEADIGAFRDETREASPQLIEGFVAGLHRVYYFGAAAAAGAALLSLTRQRPQRAAQQERAT